VLLKAADYGRSAFGVRAYVPESCALIVVREPVAMMNSLKANRIKYNRKFLTWPTLCEAVQQMNKLATMIAERPEDNRIRILRYEDLATAPEPILRDLCNWLEISFDPALCVPTMMGTPWSNNSSFARGESGIAQGVCRRLVLTEAEAAYVAEATIEFSRQFGYL
jgi:hypothetical protein